MSRPREKDTTDSYRTLGLTSLQRETQLQPGKPFEWAWWRRGEKVASIGICIESRYSLRLRYQTSRQNNAQVQHDYSIAISWTACHLGGERPWLHCPNCERRVLKLHGGTRFICRHCLRLNYASQQASKRDRALNRAWELRHQLGCDAGPFDYPAEYIKRPKGMHRKTFTQRIEKLARIEEKAIANTVTAMQKLGIRISGISP